MMPKVEALRQAYPALDIETTVPTSIMEDVKKWMESRLGSVPGLLAIIVTDREGVPVVRASTAECPETAVRPTFLGGGFNGSLAEQASKLGVGSCLGMAAVYQTHQFTLLLFSSQNLQLVHCLCEELVVTLVARVD